LKIEQNHHILQERIFGQMHLVQNEDGSNPSFAVHALYTLFNLIKQADLPVSWFFSLIQGQVHDKNP
jgi:hypothetical protein